MNNNIRYCIQGSLEKIVLMPYEMHLCDTSLHSLSTECGYFENTIEESEFPRVPRPAAHC